MRLACPRCLAISEVAAGAPDRGTRCPECGAELLPGVPVALSADSFDAFVRDAGLPLVVEFSAEWCAPCAMMKPVLEAVAAELRTEVRFATVDTEAHPRVSMRHHIRGVPTLILFRAGREVARHAGAMEAHALRRWLLAQGIGQAKVQ